MVGRIVVACAQAMVYAIAAGGNSQKQCVLCYAGDLLPQIRQNSTQAQAAKQHRDQAHMMQSRFTFS